jgi:hypothetical protein
VVAPFFAGGRGEVAQRLESIGCHIVRSYLLITPPSDRGAVSNPSPPRSPPCPPRGFASRQRGG